MTHKHHGIIICTALLITRVERHNRYLALEADNEALRKRVSELVMSYSNGLKGPQAADLIEAGHGNDSQARLDLTSMLSNNAVPQVRSHTLDPPSPTAHATQGKWEHAAAAHAQL